MPRTSQRKTPSKKRSARKPPQELTAAPLMGIATGFFTAKTLAAAVELDIFTKLSGKNVSQEEFELLTDLQPRPAEMLLSACVALGLLDKRSNRFRNSRLGEEFLVRGKPYYFGGMVTMCDRSLYLPWHRLSEALRTNRRVTFLAEKTTGAEPDWAQSIAARAEDQRIFTEAMHSTGIQIGKALSGAFDFSRHKQLLDVGGGSGAYCIEAAKRYRRLRAIVFDISPALEIAREKIAGAGLSDRVTTQAGDFFKDDLPKGSDVVLLSAVLHDWSPEKCMMIVQKCFDALPSGGVIIVNEIMMDDDKTGPLPAALMSLNMLVATEGRNYSWAEYTEWLEKAGFRRPKRVSLREYAGRGLLVGSKP